MASQTPPPVISHTSVNSHPNLRKTHPTDESHGGVGAQGRCRAELEPQSATLRHAACVQSRLVGVAFGCEARPTRGIDAARGMGDRLSRIFVLHDTPKFVVLGVEYAIATEGARPSLPSDVPSGESSGCDPRSPLLLEGRTRHLLLAERALRRGRGLHPPRAYARAMKDVLAREHHQRQTFRPLSRVRTDERL